MVVSLYSPPPKFMEFYDTAIVPHDSFNRHFRIYPEESRVDRVISKHLAPNASWTPIMYMKLSVTLVERDVEYNL